MEKLFSIQYSYLIPLLPLIGAGIVGLFGARFLKQKSHWPIWIGVGVSAVLSLMLLFNMLGLWREGAKLWNARDWYTWIDAGPFKAAAGHWIDPLSAVMLCVVTGIGFFIIVFAAKYMQGEEGYFRFFAYLGLFIFAMTILVMANNFVMLYLGWEGVGLCSYLLIGYYYEKPSAREAAKKAFLVNRVGDFGFGLGIMLIFLAFKTVSFYGTGPGSASPGVLELATHLDLNQFQKHALQWIPFLLMVGAFGKSAQFPLYVWLPDAMEGPTPVSALIHAATMVTAGVYMIARCGTLFVGSAAAMGLIAAVGAFTALFAASIAMRQFDLKKIFAYSTISQLGFMFVGVGVLAPVAGVFHLVTHAFFKALLFLASGVVMHAMAGELDIRKMSGLRSVLPKTRWLMLIGCAALAGFPFLSGFFSKDEIVGAAWEYSKPLAMVLLLTAFLTAYYTFRAYFRVFHGPLMTPTAPAHDHDADHHHDHEPAGMILPLVVLAIGAILAGYLNFPSRHHDLGDFLGQSPSFQLAYDQTSMREGVSPAGFGRPESRDKLILEQAGNVELMLMWTSGLISLLGIWLAYFLHKKNRDAAERLASRLPETVDVLDHKYWVDEIYQAAIIEPLRTLGRVFYAIDRAVVDGIVWAIGIVPQLSGFALKLSTERGYLQGYAAVMLLGIAIILLLIFV